ncbi:hypothetical protein Droror1_Dr00011815 [Drosera rotundifolia]
MAITAPPHSPLSLSSHHHDTIRFPSFTTLSHSQKPLSTTLSLSPPLLLLRHAGGGGVGSRFGSLVAAAVAEKKKPKKEREILPEITTFFDDDAVMMMDDEVEAAEKKKKPKKKSRRYVELQTLREFKKEYDVKAAISLLKQMGRAKFVETVEAHFRLNIDPRYNDQQIRATVDLPKGSGKSIKIAVLAQGTDTS